MPRIKSLNRDEYRAAVINMLDLGFTPPAIAYMTGKSDVSVYTMLERAGRKTGRRLKRHVPEQIDPNVARYASRLFDEPELVIQQMCGLAKSHRAKRK